MSTPKEVKVIQTPLPGIGLRLEFVTADGQRVGVVQRQQGDLQLFISHADDPDLAATSLNLTENEVATLTGLLGGSASLTNCHTSRRRPAASPSIGFRSKRGPGTWSVGSATHTSELTRVFRW